MAVLARGRIDVYEARGEYQLLVELLEPQGLGALQLAFEQLKKKLAAEGLFAADRKRPLPRFPRRIGIVTSPRGAAIADMIQILSRRFPGLHIRLFPALVQGEGSVEEVCRGDRVFQPHGLAGRVDCRPRRRFAGRPLDVQHGSRGARHRGLLDAGDFGGGPRNRCDDRRFRGRPARSHAFGGRGDGGLHARRTAGPHRGGARQGGAGHALPDRHAGAPPAAAGNRPRAGHSAPACGPRAAAHRRAGIPHARADRAAVGWARAGTGALAEQRLRRFDVRPRLAADRRRMELARNTALQVMRARLAQDRQPPRTSWPRSSRNSARCACWSGVMRSCPTRAAS